MAGLPLTILTAACCFLFNSAAGALQLPNVTYLPSISDEFPVKTIVESLGLKFESYKVTTHDGYILNLNRIVNPDIIDARNYGVPVLFVNGLALQAESWFLQTKPESNIPVAWLLAGYDIWIGDQRGTFRSREHVNLTVNDKRFWDFTFHEMGVYDFPSFIDFILAATGQPKLALSGLSSGGSSYYIMCAEKPEYQDKLYGGILWAPVGESPDVATLYPPTMRVVLSGEKLMMFNWRVGIGEAPPLFRLWRRYVAETCRVAQANGISLDTVLFSPGCQPVDNICFVYPLSLGGTSSKSFSHAIQLYKNGGVFQQYNYGPAGNRVKYGQPDPPKYDISKLKVPTALYSSVTDVYAPSWMVVPFSKKFGGPTYLCEFEGVCHVFTFLDSRVEPYVQDSIEVLNSMTGRTSRDKMDSKRCNVPSPPS